MPNNQPKAKDPKQLQLRQHKRNWNAAYKDLTGKLKAFKNGLNGKGDAKHSLPPSDIKNPFPTEVGGYLNQLAGEFQALVSDANAIIKEQDNYSRTRQKKQPKRAPSIVPPEGDKIVEDLSRIASFSFEKDASNKLTRFWQYFKSVFSREEMTKFRISMLRMSADLHYSMLDFQNEVLSLEIGSIPRSITKYQMAQYNFNALKRSISNLKDFVARSKEEQKSQPKKDQEASLPEPEQTAEQPLSPTPTNDIASIKRDIHELFNTPVPAKVKSHLVQLNALIAEYDSEEDEHLKSVISDRIVSGYNDAMKAINATNKKANANSEIIKEAHNAITRYLKKQVVKAVPFNKTAAHRIEVSDLIDSCDKIIKQLMDHLESDIQFEAVEVMIAQIGKQITEMGKPLSVLVIFYKVEFYKTKRHDKHKNVHLDEDPMMDWVMTRKVRRDLGRDIE